MTLGIVIAAVIALAAAVVIVTRWVLPRFGVKT